MVSFDVGPSPDTLDAVLRRRGHRMLATGDVVRVLLPEERLGELLQTYAFSRGIERAQRVFTGGVRERYHALFGQASFRKLARRLVLAHGECVSLDLLRDNAGDRVTEYIGFLEALGVVESTDEGVRCTRPLDNFGPSLEHYVARLCEWDLRGTAAWGVQLEGLPHAGGDYDVLAWLSPALVYIECKSARTSDISDDELRHFLQRHVELAPDTTVLLVDTADDLKGFVDRLNGIIAPVIKSSPLPDILIVGGDEAKREVVQQPDYLGVWFGAYLRVYVTNTEPSILSQLQRSLQHYHALVRGRAVVPAMLPRFTEPI